MKVDESMSGFRPMLCQEIREEDLWKYDGREWYAERKLDGVRAWYDVKTGKLFSRRGNDITSVFPECVDAWSSIFNDGMILGGRVWKCGDEMVVDGEIVAGDGELSTVVARMHLRDSFMTGLAARTNPCRFVSFCAVRKKNGVYAQWRLKEIESGSVGLMWELAKRNGWEGIVVKKDTSVYEVGKRSELWKKCKVWSEKKHTFVAYEEHERGVTLVDGDGRRLVVNGADARVVKRCVDEKGKVVVVVQFLEQENGVWRFPSFRGVV